MARPGLGQPANRRLGDLLLAEGLLTSEQLQQALSEQQRSRERLGSILVRLRFLDEDRLIEFLARQYGVPSVRLDGVELDPDVLRLVPPALARKHEVVPIRRVGQTLTLAMADPTNVFALDEIGFVTDLQPLPVVASQAAIRRALARWTEGPAARGPGSLVGLGEELVSSAEASEPETGLAADVLELRESAAEAPVVKLVNRVLAEAIRRRASDIHWEPYEAACRVRLRVDGVLQELLSLPRKAEPALVSRLKIMASLDIAERRLPQDGRIRLRHDRRIVDFRISTLPTIFGEKVVLRILDQEALKLDLAQLGFEPWALDAFRTAIHQPHGMIFITGPTGSGKTTTLYSAIHAINRPGLNIMTVEDPVEYNLPGVNQVQVNEPVGRTFAAALRAFLRQDPDVILVGETRDLETAQIAVRAALTGHLVLSTLHTNDCPSTVARLRDMGVAPFLVASSLRLVLAQRLGRRVCQTCAEPYETDEGSLVPYGHRPSGRGRVRLLRGRGCPACNFTGLKGRVALYEVMPVNQAVRDMIVRGASPGDLRALAQEQGLPTLRQAGLAKALEGVTTVDEVLRVTTAD